MRIKKTSLMWVFFLFVSLPTSFAYISPPPEPPVDNPHPAVSEADKKRVAFAEQVIKHLQIRDSLQEKSKIDLATDFSAKIQLNISEKCLLSAQCLSQTDKNGYLKAFKAHFGPVKTYQHVHIIPWSFKKFQDQRVNKSETVPGPSTEVVHHDKSDDDEVNLYSPKAEGGEGKFMFLAPEILRGEYMIHSYATFDHDRMYWHHLNIIVSEDENGELKLQRLYTTPLPSSSEKLPPGVDC